MRRGTFALIVVLGCGLVVTPAQAHRQKRAKMPSGVKGVVFDASCPGACAQPAPPEPVYTGSLTVEVTRASDGTVVASQAVSDGHFRIRLKPGSYDVASVPPTPPPTCQPQPGYVCPLAAAGPEPAVIVAPCETGESQRVQVHRHRFTRVELHVRNSCIA
jgi:hypothetical protein